MSNIQIEQMSYGGIKVQVLSKISYDDIVEFSLTSKNAKYITGISKKIKRNIEDIGSQPKHRPTVEKWLDIIQTSTKELFVEILTKNPYDRFIIYTICNLLGLKHQTIKEHGKKLVGCNEYLPKSERRLIGNKDTCGCAYAPKNFWKHHVNNNYEDTVSYSIMPWTTKVGVRVFKNISL